MHPVGGCCYPQPSQQDHSATMLVWCSSRRLSASQAIMQILWNTLLVSRHCRPSQTSVGPFSCWTMHTADIIATRTHKPAVLTPVMPLLDSKPHQMKKRFAGRCFIVYILWMPPLGVVLNCRFQLGCFPACGRCTRIAASLRPTADVTGVRSYGSIGAVRIVQRLFYRHH